VVIARGHVSMPVFVGAELVWRVAGAVGRPAGLAARAAARFPASTPAAVPAALRTVGYATLIASNGTAIADVHATLAGLAAS
jgi:hypothetical protein